MTKINIGCGMTPTRGWKNYDNSLSLKLAKYRFLTKVLEKLKLLNQEQLELIKFCKHNQIFWADATKKIPEDNDSITAIYSSHMFEHLDKRGATEFLAECYRILKPNGILRIVIPDIEIAVSEYLNHKDADKFIESTLMCVDAPRTFRERLKLLVVGNRHHQWMYDGKSLSKKLMASGFVDVSILPAGTTSILDYGTLDLSDKQDQSVFIEAKKTKLTLQPHV
jgi:SAM-dependent methyltransferase